MLLDGCSSMHATSVVRVGYCDRVTPTPTCQRAADMKELGASDGGQATQVAVRSTGGDRRRRWATHAPGDSTRRRCTGGRQPIVFVGASGATGIDGDSWHGRSSTTAELGRRRTHDGRPGSPDPGVCWRRCRGKWVWGEVMVE
ncbi:hypothetical protein ACLOJK_041046 [Asimina triloba]